MPKISVLMPVYNTKEEYLREAIDSILRQTYGDFELIILNDCSTDENVERVVKSYTDSRIRYVKNDYNLGISPSRNKLLDMANGEYLAIMDHDDISLPERFAKEANFLDEYPDVGVVSCWYERFPDIKVKTRPYENDRIEEELMFSCPILHPASMIRKKVLLDNNIRYEEKFSPAEDYAMWCRMIGKTKFANLQEVLFRYRDHKNNTSKTQSKKMKEASFKITSFAMEQNHEIWERFKAKATIIYKIYLFNKIPLFGIKKTPKKMMLLLLMFIPVFVLSSNKSLDFKEKTYTLFGIPLIRTKMRYKL